MRYPYFNACNMQGGGMQLMITQLTNCRRANAYKAQREAVIMDFYSPAQMRLLQFRGARCFSHR